MPDCSHYLSIISELVDDEASTLQAEQLRAHMESCRGCRRVYNAFRDISEAMPEGLVETPAELAPGIMFKINAQKKAGKAPSGNAIKTRAVRYLSIAACLALVLFGASRFGLLDGLTSQSAKNADGQAVSGGEFYAFESEIMDAPDEELSQVPDASAPEERASDFANAGEAGGQPVKFTEMTGLLNSNFASNSLFIESEMERLREAGTIALYEGRFVPGSDEYAGVLPILDALDKKSRDSLFELMTADALIDLDDASAEALDTSCTIVFTGVKLPDSNVTTDLTVAVWIYDDTLYFRISSEPPIVYRSDTFPIDFQEFLDGLLSNKR